MMSLFDLRVLMVVRVGLLCWATSCAHASVGEAQRPVKDHPMGVRPLGATRTPNVAPYVLQLPWSASGFEIQFRGSQLAVTLSHHGTHSGLGPAMSLWQVTVDGQRMADLQVFSAEPSRFLLAHGLGDGPHVAQVVRRSEAQLGEAILHEVSVLDGHLLPPLPPRGRRVAIIGDSITAGFGNLCTGENEIATASNEDALVTYGALAAQDVGADLHVIAWSGRGVWRNGDGRFDGTLPSLWDQAPPPYAPPDAIIINVGTNDFRRPDVDDHGFVTCYSQWVMGLLQRYPKSHIFLAVGPMLTDAYPPGAHALGKAHALVAQVHAQVSHTTNHGGRVHLLEFTPQDGSQGFGCAYHPNGVTHRRMAQTLATALRTTLGW